MKICLPTRDGVIDAHFGHCDHYTIYTIENRQIVAEETMASPAGCGCKSGIAPVLAQAKNVLNASGIEVIRGCSGPVREVAEAWLRGELKDNQIACDHHDCGHH